jgi:hypothetical protein
VGVGGWEKTHLFFERRLFWNFLFNGLQNDIAGSLRASASSLSFSL